MSKIDYSTWPPREWRAFLALIASVLGSIALTVFAAGLVWILWQGDWPLSTAETRVDMLGRALTISLGGSLLVLITLGMAINRRSIKVSSNGFEATGGDEDETPPVVTTTTTTTTQVAPVATAEVPAEDADPAPTTEE